MFYSIPAQRLNFGRAVQNLVAIAVSISALWVAGVWLNDWVPTLGWQIPGRDVKLDYIMGCGWAITIALSILVWPIPIHDRLPLALAWLCKFPVVLCVMLFYESYYDLDCFGYFLNGASMDSLIPSFSNNIGVLNICYVHNLLLPGSFHALKVTFAATGLLAVYITYRGTVLVTGREDYRVFFVLALFPSILFWSSIIGKDPLTLLGISMYAFGVMGWCSQERGGYFVPVFLGVLLAATLRPWLAIVFLVPVGILMLSRFSGRSSKVALFLFLIVAAFLLKSSTASFVQRFHIDETSDLFSRAETISGNFGAGTYGEKRSNTSQVHFGAKLLPYAMFSALYRPLPGDVPNVFGLLAGCEGVLLLWLTWRALRRTRVTELREPVVLWAISCVLLWSVFYGVTALGNMGALARFKLQILPIFVSLLLYLGRDRTTDVNGRTRIMYNPFTAREAP